MAYYQQPIQTIERKQCKAPAGRFASLLVQFCQDGCWEAFGVFRPSTSTIVAANAVDLTFLLSVQMKGEGQK